MWCLNLEISFFKPLMIDQYTRELTVTAMFLQAALHAPVRRGHATVAAATFHAARARRAGRIPWALTSLGLLRPQVHLAYTNINTPLYMYVWAGAREHRRCFITNSQSLFHRYGAHAVTLRYIREVHVLATHLRYTIIHWTTLRCCTESH